VVVLATGCASALREPPPVADLGGRPEVAARAGGDGASLLEHADSVLAQAPDTAAVERARDLYLRAMTTEEAPVEAFLGGARATAWLVEHEPDARRREQLAISGVEIGQWCGRRFPTEPACRYRLALAVGQQARERPTTAVDGLKVMVALLEALVEEAPDLDSAGPDRVLALVLLRAPGWPTGPGDPEVGLEHARAAVKRQPDFPPNQLVLGEALLDNGDRDGGRAALERGRALADERAARGSAEAAEWAAEARERLSAGR